MKPGIHPKYADATVVCACGNTFQTRSAKPNLRTDLCNVCHPFYTGEQRIVDTAGQVERFLRRMETAAGDTRVSKRQQRLNERATKAEEERLRVETEAQLEKEWRRKEVRFRVSCDPPGLRIASGWGSWNGERRR